MFCSYNTQGAFICKKLSTNNSKLSNTSPCNCSSNKFEKYTIPDLGAYTTEPTPTPTPTTTESTESTEYTEST
jgi:hypothetical protein